MIQVIDNFLTKSYHEELLNIMNSTDFDWYYNGEEMYDYPNHSGDHKIEDFGFTHIFFDQDGMRSDAFAFLWRPALLQILDTIGATSIIRSKANMTMFSPTHKDYLREPHVDMYIPNISTIYYLNDTDGDTFLYDQKLYSKHQSTPKDYKIIDRVSPKANRLIAFDGLTLHSAQNPSEHKNRIIINSNFGV